MLYERVLTEDANRKSTALWQHYLAFEFEMGDLQSALRLEKRAREALGEAPPAAGMPAASAGSARNMQLLLLRYQFGDAMPCPPEQQQYLQYLAGKGQPPAGFERAPRGSTGSKASGGGYADAGDRDRDRDTRCGGWARERGAWGQSLRRPFAGSGCS